MKRHIKKIIAIALCVSMMQPTLQAGPFQDFARKWVARGAAVGYWGIIASPLVGSIGFSNSCAQLREDINKSDDNGEPYFPELRTLDPKKYAAINALYKQEGLEALDGYSIKVATRDGLIKFIENDQIGIMSKAILHDKYDGASALGGNHLIVGEVLVQQTTSEECLNNVCKTISVRDPLSTAGLASVLAHEKRHNDANHLEKGLLLNATAPFVLGAMAHGMVEKMPMFVRVRSLLKIIQATGIVGISTLMYRWYWRENEREADSSVKNAPTLARGLMEALQDLKSNEDSLVEQPHTLINAMLSTHPSDEERMAYLEKWAQEAEAKQKNK